jgi:hypothetical protein
MEINVLGQKLRVELIIMCILVVWFISANMFCSCAGGVKEGFNAALDLSGAALDYTMGTGVKGSWDKPRASREAPNINASLEGNIGGPIPLPEGELFIWRENKSDPNCCPATYSTSEGCICSSPEQMTYLNERGGNRTCGGSKSCYEEY